MIKSLIYDRCLFPICRRCSPLACPVVTRSPYLVDVRYSSSLSLAERRRRRMMKKSSASPKKKEGLAEPPRERKTFFNFSQTEEDGGKIDVKQEEVKGPPTGSRTSRRGGNAHRKRAFVPSVTDKGFDAFINANKSVNRPRGKNKALKAPKATAAPRTKEEEAAIDQAVAELLQVNVEKAEVAVGSMKTPNRKNIDSGETQEQISEREQKAHKALHTFASTPSGQKKVASAIARLQKSKVGRDLRKRYAETRKEISTLRKREGIPSNHTKAVIVQDTAKNIAAVMETSSDTPKGKGIKAAVKGNVLTYPDYREKVLIIFQQLAEINVALGEKYKTASYQIAVDRLKKDDFIFKELPPNLIPLPESYIQLVQEHKSGLQEGSSKDKQALVAEIEENLRKRTQLLSSASVSGAEAKKGGANYLGVGDKLKKKIIEILKTGDLEELHVFEAKPIIKAIRALTQVHGFGPRTALTFYKTYRIETVEQLKEAVKEQEEDKGGKKTKKVPTFRLTDAQKVGLKYYKDIQLRIPHSEGRLHEAFLKLRLKKHLNTIRNTKNSPYELVLCGSYRRKCETSGDIDVLLTRSPISKHEKDAVPPAEALSYLVQCLENDKYLEAHLASGNTKYMGVCRLPAYEKDGKMRKFPARRIDIRYVDIYSYPAALSYFTGSKNFNVLVRAEAIKKGFILNEYGLFKQGKIETSKLHTMIQKLAKAQYYIGGSPRAEEDEQEVESGITVTKRKGKPLREDEIAVLEEYHRIVEQQRVKVKCEEDIFEAIGMDYVAPPDRDV